jgi:hypothetical protein
MEELYLSRLISMRPQLLITESSEIHPSLIERSDD